MKRLTLIACLLVAAALPASAPAAACSPLNCAPSGTPLGNGLLAARPSGVDGPVRVIDLAAGATRWKLPSGLIAGTTLVHADGAAVSWYDATTGKQTATAAVDAPVGGWHLAGLSQDGSRAVLLSSTRVKAQVLIVSATDQRSIELPGSNWDVDTLTGNNLFLLHYLKNGYEIRRYDLAAGRLVARPLKDPHESSLIWGIPWSRVSTADGRYLFTLYVASNGATMIHKLDLRTSRARCIDLPGTGNFNAAATYAMELSPDGRTLWAISPGYGRAVAIDVRQEHVSASFRFARADPYGDTPTSSVSSLSRDGSRMAVGTAGEIWVFTLGTHAVTKTRPYAALALGFSPDGSTLWAVGKGDALVALAA
jgi:hypothetical protein